MDIINTMDLSAFQWFVLIAAAFMVGFSKTGINGLMTLVIPVLASIFGGKESTGMILPMLIAGDIMAVWYYHRHGDWGDIRKLLPWSFAGIVSGTIVGKYIDDAQFKALIAILVLACLLILVYMEKKGDALKVPKKMWFFALTGIAAGFASMIGNAAGPIFSIYLLSRGFKKNDFMGTTAWFFLIINLTKLPFQIFYWHNVTGGTLITAGILLPVILLGAFIGIVIIRKINEKPFRYIILAMTALTAVRLFI